MRATKYHMRGFSLIELCVSLVVIGIVAGGIMGTVSLRRTMQVKSVMDQTAKMTEAVTAFKDRYGGLPGDIINASDKLGGTAPDGTAISAGNGNGIIELGTESLSAVEELIMAGLIEGKVIVDVSTRGELVGPITGSAFIVASDTQLNGSVYNDISFTGANLNAYEIPILTSSEMQQIDIKYDDGMPNTGTIHAISGYRDGNPPAAIPSNCTTGVLATDTYDLTTAPIANNCVMECIVQSVF